MEEWVKTLCLNFERLRCGNGVFDAWHSEATNDWLDRDSLTLLAGSKNSLAGRDIIPLFVVRTLRAA
jgi:hypothetical protein